MNNDNIDKIYLGHIAASVRDEDILEEVKRRNIQPHSFKRIRENYGYLYFDKTKSENKNILSILGDRGNNYLGSYFQLPKGQNISVSSITFCSFCKKEGHREFFCLEKNKKSKDVKKENSRQRSPERNFSRRSPERNFPRERVRSRSPRRNSTSRSPLRRENRRSLSPKRKITSPNTREINDKFCESFKYYFSTSVNRVTGEIAFGCFMRRELYNVELWFNKYKFVVEANLGIRCDLISLANLSLEETIFKLKNIFGLCYATYFKIRR
jgi:hypothetical protein